MAGQERTPEHGPDERTEERTNQGPTAQRLIRRLDRRWVSTLARFGIGGIFLFAGATKVVDIDGTIRAVRAYQLLPEAIVPTVGAALPILELGLAFLLLSGLLTRLAAVLSVPLCLAFFGGVASAWIRGLEIECGCFGDGGATTDPIPGYVRELVLNAVLLAAAAWLIRHPSSRWSLDRPLGLDGSSSIDPGGLDEPDDHQPATPTIGASSDQR